MTREEVIELLLESGSWPSIIQRPFATIANPEKTPKAIGIIVKSIFLVFLFKILI